MQGFMSTQRPNQPRIGIPWRTSEEEAQGNHPKIQAYEDSVREAGGEPVLLSLVDPAHLESELNDLQGFILPGSPHDVDPKEYGAVDRGVSAKPDPARERTDRSILDHAFAHQKPVLAICYGCQLLNVYLGGTLVQDVPSETGSKTVHSKKNPGLFSRQKEVDPKHEVRFENGSRLAELARGRDAEINSSHHQSVEKPGRNLKITGQAGDGVVESVEWTGDSNWVVGVQWHPERMAGDPLATRLFADFVNVARASGKITAGKS
jgi:putative glutamine amidotransferase